jgi:hypothetical protein
MALGFAGMAAISWLTVPVLNKGKHKNVEIKG